MIGEKLEVSKVKYDKEQMMDLGMRLAPGFPQMHGSLELSKGHGVR